MNATPKLLRADGTVLDLRPRRGRKFSLAELQQAVGGPIEVIACEGQAAALLVINETGKFDARLQPNPLATRLLVEAGGIPGDFIVGDAVLLPGDMLD